VLCYCQHKKVDDEWIKIRLTNEVYPKDSITVDTVSYFSELETIQWQNMAYFNYPYKKYSTECVNITFQISNYNPFKITGDSVGRCSVERDILARLRLKGVTHLVSKTMDSYNFEIMLYLENDSVSFLDCNKILENLNWKIPYEISVRQDHEWSQYFALK
jgi:hypothetical protein